MAASPENQPPLLETLPSVESPLSDPALAAGDKRKRDSDDVLVENHETPSQANHPLWKTSLCSFFRRQPARSCGHGATCRYAHSEAELRLRPDNTWDPTSDRAKKLAKKSNEEEEAEEDDEVMMTEAVVDDGDEEGGDGDGLESKFRKCLVHLPKNWKSENLVAFLADQGISHKSAKKKKGMTVGFVGFETAEQSQKATEDLQGKFIGNKSIKIADVLPRSFEKKTNAEKTVAGEDGALDGDSNNENSTANGSSSGSGKTARDVVTPLAHMSYPDQLEHKRSSISHLLKKLTRNARKACPSGVSQPGWITNSRERGGLPCNLEGILASPLVNGYRNKCEFSVGYSLQGKITVGFMLGNFREGVTAVEEPIDCPNVSTVGCGYASIFQDFLQQSSLPVWNRFKNNGFWRQLTVREGRRSEKAVESENHEANVAEVLLMVQVCTTGVDDALVNEEFDKMAEAFSSGAATSSPSLPLTHVVVQDHRGISNVSPGDAPLRPLQIPRAESSPETKSKKNLDEPRIHDYISNLKFCISPTAFFQVNTLAAEKLYSLAGDWAGLGPDTLLFDVCCGTGTIGLTLAHRVGMVVGIEMNASAVLDAQRNAEINGIKNCRFICSKAEDVMGSLLKEYHSQTEDEVPNESENGDKITSTNGGKDISVENIQDPERISGQSSENIAEPAESSNPELENANLASECPEDSLKIPVTEPQSGTSESENTSVRTFKNVVAIVDPPRSGLHPTVIKALRTHPLLRRLVYISCNPESLVANAIELCTPSPDKIEKGKGNRGWRNMSAAGLARHRAKSMPISEPFVPLKAMAVDLFPHTPHCEMVMLLER